MGEKIYYLSDLAKIISVANEMGLKAWKLENYTGAELQKYSPTVRAPEALEKIFKYLSSELIPDGKYKLVGKTGFKATHRTEITIQKGADNLQPVSNGLNTSMAYADYNSVIQENAKLKADNYYYTEQIKVLHEQISELRAELDEESDLEISEAKSSIYETMAKEYAPQIINLVSQYFAPKSQPVMASFADAPPPSPPAPQKIIRFSPEYNEHWRMCTDQTAVNNEYNYLQANRPDKLQEFTNLFGGNG